MEESRTIEIVRPEACPEAGPGARLTKLDVRMVGKRVLLAGRGSSCPEEGAEFRTLWCPRDGTKVRLRLMCDTPRDCPRCYKRWAAREAARAASRLVAIRKKRSHALEARHVIISFWDHVVETGEELSLFAKLIYKTLLVMGAHGGLVVIHPWRHTGPLGDDCWRVGVHAHALVYGPVDASLRPPGAFVKVLPERESLAGTLNYLLEHAGFVDGGHAVRWFGSCSYNKTGGLVVPRLPEVVLCPLCSGPLEALPVEMRESVAWRPRTWGAWS